MQNSGRFKKIVIILAGCIIVLIGIGIVSSLTSSPKKQQATTTSTSQATTPPAKYRNFDTLLDYGISSEQLVSTENSTAAFVRKQAPAARIVSVNPDSIHQLAQDPNSSINTLEYTFSVDTTIYTAHLNFISLDAVELFVLDAQNTQVYDSGILQP